MTRTTLALAIGVALASGALAGRIAALSRVAGNPMLLPGKPLRR